MQRQVFGCGSVVVSSLIMGFRRYGRGFNARLGDLHIRVKNGQRKSRTVADNRDNGPDSTAERVALWRAMHAQFDSPPHIIEDQIGLRLAAPEEGWQRRPDMDLSATSGFRAAIVARARFIEDLVIEQSSSGVTQYVILGAGLDTFAQRRPEIAAQLRIFEIDQPGTLAWKRQRLIELGYGVPDWLSLVSVDFETDGDWWKQLCEAGFEPGEPAVVVCTGVTMYLTKDATAATLNRLGRLAPGSTLAMTFMLPPELIAEADRPAFDAAKPQAQASGTPFISFYTPEEMLQLARDNGFKDTQHVSGASLADRYFADRDDDLRPSSGEDLLVATT